MHLKVQVPPHTSSGQANTGGNNALSERINASNNGTSGQQPPPTRHLEVIHQASVEELSPLITTKMLNIQNSEESFEMVKSSLTTAKPFKLSLQGGSLHSNQAVPSNNAASMISHLQRLTQPTYSNHPPVSQQARTQQKRLHKHANEILSQVDTTQYQQHIK